MLDESLLGPYKVERRGIGGDVVTRNIGNILHALLEGLGGF